MDVRRFGTGDVLLGSDALSEYFDSRLGVEPLSPDFTAEALRALARGRKQPVKAFFSTGSGSPAWATSTRTRPCGGRSSTR